MLLRTLLVTAIGSTLAARVRSQLETSVEIFIEQLSDGPALQRQLAREPWDLLLVDAESVPALSPAWVRKARAIDEAEVVVLVSADSNADRAALLEAGALAVIESGLDDATLGTLVRNIADRLLASALLRLSHLPNSRYRLSDYASGSPVMRKLLATARRVAATDSTLLILGETGVGKGLLARSIHNEGPRAAQPFVTVNCSSLPETLLESELFGHTRGAFTGASRSRRGQFEVAHGGTLFLDEITEIPPHLQVKLLRAIEDRVVQPLGAEKEIAVDVRVIAASNREIEVELREKRLRQDLYYRLNVIPLALPPLRERFEDIPELVQSSIAHACQRFGSGVKGIEPGALEVLTRYAWPGNIRELRNVMERAVLLASGPDITLQDLPMELYAAPEADAPLPLGPAVLPNAAESPELDAWLDRPWSEVRAALLEAAERRYLRGILDRYAGRVGDAARHAGMAPRSLFEKL
ncbi:MAG: sigma 54-interacting transcriptional regulator, partial [Myxococcales bacterium]|nr:sigma 54-interacting transcriptional regulator [Myxococcales bacterium]